MEQNDAWAEACLYMGPDILAKAGALTPEPDIPSSLEVNAIEPVSA